jgi:hypothetical protein
LGSLDHGLNYCRRPGNRILINRSGKADLIRNIHGIAEVAGLNRDEIGYPLVSVRDNQPCRAW